jgi:hypothetical protein
MYLQRNNIAHSRNVYSSSAILTAWYYCYSNTAFFYRNFISQQQTALRSSCKVSDISIFSTDFFEGFNINFTKIRPVGAELIHVDREMDIGDMKKLIGAFREKTCVILKTPLSTSYGFQIRTFVTC